MTTTPTNKHSAFRKRGLNCSPSKRKALRRRGRRAFCCWLHLTRCDTFFRRRPSLSASTIFRRLRRACRAAALAFILPAIAQADNFIVTTSSDMTDGADGIVTLREAITLANDSPGPDTIGFTEDLSGEVIILTQGELTISDDLHIDASKLAQAPVIDADQKSRVMHFTAAEGDLELTRLTLRNGKAPYSGDDAFGGGILFASSGALTLTDSTLSGNYASNIGGYGGGISTHSGAITLTNSTLSGNSAWVGGTGGGISTDSGAITLTNSIIAGNMSDGTAPDLRAPNDPDNNLEVSHSLIGNSTGARLDEAKVTPHRLIANSQSLTADTANLVVLFFPLIALAVHRNCKG